MESVDVRWNVFPALVTVSDGREFRVTRTLISADRIWVYVDGAPRPYAAFTGKLISIEGRPSTGYTMLISTDGGDEVEVVVRRAGGCGCGNRLKGFSPPYHLRYNARSA